MRVIRWMAGIVLAGAALPALAQEIDKDTKKGAELYRVHCATCHGIEGTGHGPMAGVLVIQPTDLTVLARNEGGVFPVERVVKRIDGRDPLASHGSPMPVYGYFFEDGAGAAVKVPNGQPIMTSEPVVELLAYLQKLQSK